MAALTVGPEHDGAFVSLLTVFMAALAPMLPANGDVAAAHAAVVMWLGWPPGP